MATENFSNPVQHHTGVVLVLHQYNYGAALVAVGAAPTCLDIAVGPDQMHEPSSPIW